MKITVVGRQMSIRDDLRELAEKKLSKLDRYFDGEGKATVTFSCKRNRENIEITISAANTLFRCETDGDSFRTAIDRAVETIDRQIRKNKTRLEKRLKRSAFEDIGAAGFEGLIRLHGGVQHGGKEAGLPFRLQQADGGKLRQQGQKRQYIYVLHILQMKYLIYQ